IDSDGNVYFGSWDKKLYALNPDGMLKWSFTTGGAIKSSPAIGLDRTIYFGSSDGNFYAVGDNK
ncbi:MAG: PQQ-binding-like beta-propeller repeat protein, partial [Candidatus Scalindua sediminis]